MSEYTFCYNFKHGNPLSVIAHNGKNIGSCQTIMTRDGWDFLSEYFLPENADSSTFSDLVSTNFSVQKYFEKKFPTFQTVEISYFDIF